MESKSQKCQKTGPNCPYECDRGWDRLLDATTFLMEETARSFGGKVHFSQIKEKFGTLRIYYSLEMAENVEGSGKCMDEYLDYIVRAAERVSARTCESCGAEGVTRQRTGWYYTCCDACEDARKCD